MQNESGEITFEKRKNRMVNPINKLDFSTWESKNVLLGISGGLDSVVLGTCLKKAGLKFQLLHVNYHFRGKESDEDALFVESLAIKWNVPLKIVNFNPDLAKKGNKQQIARDFRREIFNQWKAKSENHCVFLAHHQDDQIETFFLQLIRGSGMWGLRGMKNEKQLIRPFLTVSREEIHSFALDNSIKWREDSSNKTIDYSRNILRNKLIPELVAKNPQLKEQICFLQKQFQSEIAIISRQNFKTILATRNLDFELFISWSIETKVAFTKAIDLPFWLILRLEELQVKPLGKQVICENYTFFISKNGFRWFENLNDLFPWKVSFESNLNSLEQKVFISSEVNNNNELSIRRLVKSDFILLKEVKKNALEFLKKKGWSSQERNTFLAVIRTNEVLFIPDVYQSFICCKTETPDSEVIYYIKRTIL